jgi:hypothetical protein
VLARIPALSQRKIRSNTGNLFVVFSQLTFGVRFGAARDRN